MKVVLLSKTDNFGGAARAMYRLHKGLIELGIESNILCLEKHTDDPSVFSLNLNEFQRTETHLSLIRDYIQTVNKNSFSGFTFGYPGYSIVEHPLIQATDIINIHWVAGFLSDTDVFNLTKLSKPIIWTFHDEYALTGGCHYTNDCDGFQKLCSDCPQIESNAYQIPSLTLEDRMHLFKNISSIVTPSRWLFSQVDSSKVFRNTSKYWIPNSLDLNTFYPRDSENLRNKFNFSEDSFVILFGAEDGKEKRKGFHKIIEALNHLSNKSDWKDSIENKKIQLLVFGYPPKSLNELNIPFVSTGRVDNDSTMAELYSLSDIFVLPSLQDNLPNTMLESLACGTPIISYNNGGMPDLVKDGETGYLADPDLDNSLGERLYQFWKISDSDKKKMRDNSLKLMSHYSLSKQAENYKDLYFASMKSFTITNELSDYKAKIESEFPILKSKDLQLSLNRLYNDQEQKEKVFTLTKLVIKSISDIDYDYDNTFIQKLKISSHITDFSLCFQIESKGNESIDAIFWKPTDSLPCQVDLIDVKLFINPSKALPLQCTYSNEEIKKDKIYTFYNLSPGFAFAVDNLPGYKIEIKGRIKILEPYEHESGLKEYIKSLESQNSSNIFSKILNKISK